jgi:DNA polymerase-3 subunit epsilon
VRVLFELPALVVGFDVETTGLDIHRDEPIWYGFAVREPGNPVVQWEYFALPTVQIHPGAERVHGISFEQLRAMRRRGQAVSSASGAVRAARVLSEYAARGALFVGANPLFDFSMLDSVLRRTFGDGLDSYGVALDSIDLIDIVAHDRLIDPDHFSRPHRGLTGLCAHYGVTTGGHKASSDARAAVEVLVEQVAAMRDFVEQTLGAAESSILIS